MKEQAIGIMGLAICMILSGAGSAIGLYKTGSAGVLAEDGKKFSKVIVLALLPATQGIYGFVLAVMKLGLVANGWSLFMAMLAMGVNGLVSAYLQGKTAAACIYAVGKNAAGSGK